MPCKRNKCVRRADVKEDRTDTCPSLFTNPGRDRSRYRHIRAASPAPTPANQDEYELDQSSSAKETNRSRDSLLPRPDHGRYHPAGEVGRGRTLTGLAAFEMEKGAETLLSIFITCETVKSNTFEKRVKLGAEDSGAPAARQRRPKLNFDVRRINASRRPQQWNAGTEGRKGVDMEGTNTYNVIRAICLIYE
ncbi:hypothetical protein DFH08DRAFT_824675 [Mycena albidolilacea]|uniref:Uncharacterized protein n=1 Tax=Mycena albidolilacea TaxID=1033008 RepID=A0AAD6Z4D0_9AGAR|nr:hypothetical protein DFH08DRAFT_824675 [Mycena albidolilacea]